MTTVYLDPFAFDRNRQPWIENHYDYELEYFLTMVTYQQMSDWEQYRYLIARRNADTTSSRNNERQVA